MLNRTNCEVLMWNVILRSDDMLNMLEWTLFRIYGLLNICSVGRSIMCLGVEHSVYWKYVFSTILCEKTQSLKTVHLHITSICITPHSLFSFTSNHPEGPFLVCKYILITLLRFSTIFQGQILMKAAQKWILVMNHKVVFNNVAWTWDAFNMSHQHAS